MKKNRFVQRMASRVWLALTIVPLALGCATAGSAAPANAGREARCPAPTDAPSAALPQTPPRLSIGCALRAIAPRVSECGQGEDASVYVTVVFRRSGEVASVTLPDELSSTPLGACIVGVVRQARLPPFQRATFSVAYPYRLR